MTEMEIVAKQYILQQVFEEVNWKCPARKMAVQFLIPNTESQPHNALTDSIMPKAEHTPCASSSTIG